MAEFTKEELLKRIESGESLERADLSGLALEGAVLANANLARADLTGANLSGADLKGANLTNACLKEAFLSGADLEGATLRNADLDGANLSGASLLEADLGRANLEGANLEGVKAEGARFPNAVLTDANLGKAEVNRANLKAAELSGAYLGGARLEGADLRRAVLDGTNLEEADLSSADLRECDLGTAILDGAILDGAKVFGVSMPRERLSQTLVEWWDVSRGGDGSAREEGAHVGAFLGGNGTAASPAEAAAAGPGTRFFGPGDVLKNAELEFSDGSVVEVQGQFENCKIVLGEDARLTIGQTGVLRDCRVAGQGVIFVHGRMLNGSGKALTTPKVFFVGASGTAVGTIQQPKGFTRFGFEPGCSLRLKIST